jgi:hypothetical protein
MGLINFRDIDIIDKDYLDFEGYEDFMKYLENKGVLDKFIKNFNMARYHWRKDRWVGYKDGYTLKDYLDNTMKDDYLMDCFQWASTPEGFGYWAGIEIDWN